MRGTARSITPIVLLKGDPKQDTMKNEMHDKRVRVVWTKAGVDHNAVMASVGLDTIRVVVLWRGVCL